MKISSRIDGSIRGARLPSSRPSPGAWELFPSPLAASHRTERRRHGWVPRHFSGRPVLAAQKSHGGFPAALTPQKPLSNSITFFTANIPSGRNWNHVAVPAAEDHAFPSIPAPMQPKQELLDMVDYYDDTTVEEHLEILRDPFMRRYAPADGPNLTISDRPLDVYLQTFLDATSPQEDETLRQLKELLVEKFRRPAQVSLDDIYSLYQKLPEPRMSHLPALWRHHMLAALGMTERKSAKSMLRYFAVVADVKNSGFSLTKSEWNTAMSFASRYVAVVTVVEAEAALHLWREMEQKSGIRACEVTFNILFDVASKAGKFTLSEMIYHEMGNRGFAFNRYHHVSLIHFFGLKQNSSAVRAAFRSMVEAGEMIDSTVINCVMVSLLRCGEESSAEYVYNKMKAACERGKHIPPRDYTLQRNLNKVFLMLAKFGKRHPEMQRDFQRGVMLSPDLKTYRILINHYGVKLGQFSMVAQLLDEMKWFRIPIHGAIFLALFKAFHIHGGLGSDWNLTRLLKVQEALFAAIDGGTEGLHISTWMGMYILEAFAKFSTRDELLDVYEDLRARWDLNVSDSQFMLHYLDTVLSRRGI